MNIIARLEPKFSGPSQPLNFSADGYVCWSRMQAEAGQALAAIIKRKEVERQAGDGVFFWGVGNPPALATNALARAAVQVPAIFSIMKSRPKASDIAPARTFVWRQYIDAFGMIRPLPAHALITSRADSGTGPKRSHYSLICRSDKPLELRHDKPFDPEAYRNASSAGGRVGASQVTALLRRVAVEQETSDYAANMVACLTGSYWVRLTDPDLLDSTRLSMLGTVDEVDPNEWCRVVKKIRRDSQREASPEASDRLL